MSGARLKQCSVLVVDDSDDDETLLKCVFQQLKHLRLVGRVSDGAQAIQYLNGEGIYANRQLHPFPELLLLDLRMPRVDGFEVLRWLNTMSFPDLKVVVLSGSDYGADIERAMAMGAHLYRTKHVLLNQQVAMLKGLENHFLDRFNTAGEA